MVCGALLGRLYGLKPRDAQYRLQACHDVAENNFNLPVPVNCPQLGEPVRWLEIEVRR